jgi:hypothetical protein
MVNVNYRAEAGLYHRVFGGFKISGPLGYKRFRTAAGAIRFAIEQLPELFSGPGFRTATGEAPRFRLENVVRGVKPLSDQAQK